MRTNRYSPSRLAVLVVNVVVAVLASSGVCRAQGPGGQRIKQQETFSAANVLSPAARDDWPLRARDGETVILSVTTTNFDPTVELVGPTGAVLAKNDDVRQGRQDSLLATRVERGGDYQVRVTSSNAASGGAYELTVRRFLSTDLAIGARASATLGKPLAHWHRLAADADRTIVLSARAASFSPVIEIIAPNGEPVEASRAALAQRGGSQAVFRTPQSGTYYARISAGQGGSSLASYAVTAAIARVFATQIGVAAAERSIDAGGLDLWTFKAESGDLVRVRAKAAAGEMTAQISYAPPVDPTGKLPTPEGPVPALVVLPSDPKSSGDVVALLNFAGTYQVAVSQPLGIAVGYSFDATRPAKAFGNDAGVTGMLGLGGAEFWTVDGSPGQILSFEGATERFDPELELYSPQGDLVARADDGGTGRDARLTTLLTERGRYVLRVHAHGDGGAGPYTLRRTPDPARPLPPGGRGEGIAGSGGVEVWSFEGKAGQAIILSARSPDFNVKISLFGPDAAEVASNDDGGEGTDSLLSARLPVSGVYTIWVASNGGGGHYTVQLIDAK
jgi:hypothetical protein